MSDVLHHARTTPTHQNIVARRAEFLAKINDKAEEFKNRPIPIVEVIPTVPTNCENEQERIFKRIKALNVEIEALSERYAKLMGRWYPRIEQIQSAVCERYNVTMADLSSIRRTANVVRPRQVAMYLCRELTLRSLPEIGRRFGMRDHTTVLHATRKIHALRATDEELDGALVALSAAVSGPVSLRPACSPSTEGTPCSSAQTTAI
jgi:hypothetical protein